MRDWGRVPIAEMQQHHHHQHHHFVAVPELQQLLLESGRAAGGVFFREPPASSPPQPPPPPPQFRLIDDRHLQQHLQHLVSHPPPPPQARACASSPPTPSPELNGIGDGSFKAQLMREEEEDDERNSGSFGRWPSQETRTLIRIRAEMDASFRSSSAPKSTLWEEISRKLGALGYSRSGRKCREKFENISKYYRKTKESRSVRPDGKNYRYFEELEALLGGNNNTGYEDLQQQEPGNLLTLIADGATSEQKMEDSNPHDDVNSSSESSADYNEQGEEFEQRGVKEARKKQKKKPWKARLAYIENLVKRFMEKQEATQQRFLDLLERREQERLKREEAWRKQEVAKLNREYEMRMEEHARRLSYDAALVCALQKVTGQVIDVPQQSPPVPSPYSQTNNVTEVTNVEEHNQNKEPTMLDLNNKRWPKSEVQALIQLRAAMENRFQEVGPKGQFWEEIATRLSYQGYHRSAKRCKEKWENINKYYRKTSSKKRPENAKTCPYFQELDALYQKGIIGTPGRSLMGSGSHSHKVEETTEELDETSNRDDSNHAQGGEAEVLSIPGGATTPSNGATTTTNTTTGLFSSPENCVNNTESRLPCGSNVNANNASNRSSGQKRSWIDGSGNSLGLGFDATASGLFVGTSNKTLKFDGFTKDILEAHRQFDQHQQQHQQNQQQHQQQQQQQQHRFHQLMQGRQSQEFQEVESSATRACNLVEGFGLGGLGVGSGGTR